MTADRRQAALAALGLFVALFLPWYQETIIASGSTKLEAASVTLSGWAAFSFVEAAVLLVAVGVLALLFQRAEGRAFHLPGGDGWVITAGGLWTCALIVWRIFDKQGTSGHGQLATTSGVEWGIFIALAVAAALAYSGTRIRAAHQPEPRLPGEPRAGRQRRDPRRPTPPMDGGADSWRSPGWTDPTRRTDPQSDALWRTEPQADPWIRREQPPRRPRPVPAEEPPTKRLAGSSPEPEDELTLPFERDK
ncbi:MAG: hypothetical protein ACR2IP_04645 [Solirubrobacteraceae bacterium]